MHRNQRGLTLVELLVAATIGSVVLGAVVQALVVSSRHYARADALAQMQEQADVALRFLRDDIRMAGHWGALRSADAIAGRALPGDANPDGIALPSRCDPAFTTALAQPITLTRIVSDWGCRVGAVHGSDALAVRYASAAPQTAQRNRLQIVGDTLAATLSTTAAAAATPPPGHAIRDLAVRGYYVAPRSTVFPDQPVLRRLTLNALTRGPLFIDEEIVQGIEALRVAVHVDGDGDGAADTTLRAGDARWPDEGAATLEVMGDAVTFPADGHMRIATTQTVRVRNAGWPR